MKVQPIRLTEEELAALKAEWEALPRADAAPWQRWLGLRALQGIRVAS